MCSNSLGKINPDPLLLGRYILPLKDFVNKNVTSEGYKL
jgi:hypothetical protein